MKSSSELTRLSSSKEKSSFSFDNKSCAASLYFGGKYIGRLRESGNEWDDCVKWNMSITDKHFPPMGSRNIFPWPLVKKGIQSHLRTVKVSQTRILIKMVVTCKKCVRHRVEHGMFRLPSRKCAHSLHGNPKASQLGEQAASEMRKEIISKWSTFAPVGAGKGGIYTCLTCFKTSWRPLGWNFKSGSYWGGGGGRK